MDAPMLAWRPPKEWIKELVRIYRDFRVVSVMGQVQNRIQDDKEPDYGKLKDIIDDRLSEYDGDPIPWADIKDEVEQEWLWSAWIPWAEMTLLVGQQGAGKSALALYLADCVANGRNLPDGSSIPERYGVLWVETEGRQAENMRRARSRLACFASIAAWSALFRLSCHRTSQT